MGSLFGGIQINELNQGKGQKDINTKLDAVSALVFRYFEVSVWFVEILGRRWLHYAGYPSPSFTPPEHVRLTNNYGLVSDGWYTIPEHARETLIHRLKLILDEQGKDKEWSMHSNSAVIFDLDGTLLDTIHDLTDAMNAALTKMGYPSRSVEECKYLVGDGVDVFARRALPTRSRHEKTVEELINIYREEYATRWTQKTQPYEGIVEMLSTLNDCGVPCAILSNKREATVAQSVSQFLPSVSFTEIRGARTSAPLKPDPTPALDIARNLDVAPEDVVFVGDTKTDMQTAVSAAMIPVGAVWGFRSADELSEHGARFLIQRPSELFSLLDVNSKKT